MLRPLLTRRIQRQRRLSLLLLRRHLLLHRSGAGVAMLQALGLRHREGYGLVWHRWESLASQSGPAAPLEVPETHLTETQPAASAVEARGPIAPAEARATEASAPAAGAAEAPQSLISTFRTAGRKLLDRLLGRSLTAALAPGSITPGPPQAAATPAPAGPRYPEAGRHRIESAGIPSRDLTPRDSATVGEPVLGADLPDESTARLPTAEVRAPAEEVGARGTGPSVEPVSRFEQVRVAPRPLAAPPSPSGTDAVHPAPPHTAPPAAPAPVTDHDLEGPRDVVEVVEVVDGPEAGIPVRTAEAESRGAPLQGSAAFARPEESQAPRPAPAPPLEPAPLTPPAPAAAGPEITTAPVVESVPEPVVASVAEPAGTATEPPAASPSSVRPKVSGPAGSPPLRVAEERHPRRPPPTRPGPVPRRSRAPAQPLESAPPRVEGPVDPAALFEPRAEGRAASDWLGRLQTAASPEPAPPAGAPAGEARRRVHPRTPIAESARRFLRPLVGIDPAEVIVHRGPVAERVAATYHADAVARGEEIALGLAGSDRDPETLALLAHELTHVARHRAPRFVPPVARGGPAPPAGGSDEEESIALRVESRVRSLAAGEAESPARARPRASPAAEVASPGGASLADVPATEEPSAGVGPSAPSPGAADRSQWGELPAPWELLPQFIWSAPALVADGDAGGPGPSQSEGSGGGAAAVVQRAAVDRGEAREAAPAPPSPGATPGQAAPDIDALARQVYGVLRRRLAAERRRDG